MRLLYWPGCMNSFKRTSSLSESEISSIRVLLEGKQPFSIYFNAALEDLSKGIDNRWIHLSTGTGIAMGIEFDDLSVFSIIGQVSDDVVAAIAENAKRCEFHVSKEYAARLALLCSARISRRSELRYYLLKREKPFPIDSGLDIRRLTQNELSEVHSFYSSNYGQTIFSSWMLEQPFFGLFVEDQLVSSGGTIVIDRQDMAANIGNFLTAPDFRGKGYSKVIAKTLINALLQEGIHCFSLGTTAENLAACRVYESVGFVLNESRIELELTGKAG